jgi:muramoyltetrapeptide carboxypeptidase LdcA involved in peptidoglycan recycling
VNRTLISDETNVKITNKAPADLSLVKILSFLNAFGISNIHESEFKVRLCGYSDVTMLRLAKIRRKEFLRITGTAISVPRSELAKPAGEKARTANA